MLVLTRKLGEKLHIGSSVIVTVTKIAQNKVRLGIDAPRTCLIQRHELLKHVVPIESAGKAVASSDVR